MGRRLNTREQRGKDKLMAERQRLVERAKVICPSYRPPIDYRPFNTKRVRKIYVPVKEYPDYKFIGLILGPRGLTQRQMEQETGAKISLRGKGSVREGKNRSATRDGNEDDDLHVVISADSEESLDHAEALIRRLLVPVEEGKNNVKREQLRKLAEITGTLRDNNYGFEREERYRRAPSFEVLCRWCGESSHPSSDCTMKGRGAPPAQFSGSGPSRSAPPSSQKVVTKEFYDLMLSIGEDVSGMIVKDTNGADKTRQDADNDYDALLASVGVDASSRTAPGNAYHHSERSFPQPSGQAGDIPPWERDSSRPPWENDSFAPARSHNANAPFNPPPSDAPAPWDVS